MLGHTPLSDVPVASTSFVSTAIQYALSLVSLATSTALTSRVGSALKSVVVTSVESTVKRFGTIRTLVLSSVSGFQKNVVYVKLGIASHIAAVRKDGVLSKSSQAGSLGSGTKYVSAVYNHVCSSVIDLATFLIGGVVTYYLNLITSSSSVATKVLGNANQYIQNIFAVSSVVIQKRNDVGTRASVMSNSVSGLNKIDAVIKLMVATSPGGIFKRAITSKISTGLLVCSAVKNVIVSRAGQLSHVVSLVPVVLSDTIQYLTLTASASVDAFVNFGGNFLSVLSGTPGGMETYAEADVDGGIFYADGLHITWRASTSSFKYSTTGEPGTWTDGGAFPGSLIPKAMIFWNGKFVVGGALAGGFRQAYSDDGINWTGAAGPSFNIEEMAISGSRIVALGTSNTYAFGSGTNGTTWGTSATFGVNVNKLASNGTRVIGISTATNSTQYVDITSTTVTTRSLTSPSGVGWRGIDANTSGKFMVYAQTSPTVKVTTDGTNWTTKTIPGATHNWTLLIGGTNNHIILNGTVGASTLAYVTVDGDSWITVPTTSAIGNSWSSGVFANEYSRWVAVAVNTATDYTLYAYPPTAVVYARIATSISAPLSVCNKIINKSVAAVSVRLGNVLKQAKNIRAFIQGHDVSTVRDGSTIRSIAEVCVPQQIKVLLKEYNLPSVVSTVLQMAVTSTFVITSVVVGSVVMQTMKGFVASVASGLGFNKTQQSVKDAVSQSNVGYQKISLKVNHLLSGAIAHVVKAINTAWDAISTSVASQSYILFVSAETILLELLATSGTVASRIQDITKNLIRASVSSSTVPKSLETSRTATGTGVGSVTKRWLTEVIGFGSNVVSKVTNVATAVFFTATSEASLLKQSTLQLLALAYHTVLLESFRFRYLVLTAVSAVQSSYAKAVYKVTGVEAAASLLMVKALSRTSALTSMAVGYVVKTYNKTVNLTLSAVSFVAKQSQLLQDVVAVNTVVAIKRANLLYELAVGNVVSKVKDVVVNRVTMVMGEMATVRFYTTDTIVAVSTGVTNVVKSVPQIITAISVGFAEKMLRIGEQTFRDLISFFVRFGNRVEYNEVIRIQENPIVFDNIEVTEVQLPGIETTEVFFE